MLTFDDCVEIHETVEMEKWHRKELERVYEEAWEYSYGSLCDEEDRSALNAAGIMFLEYLRNADLSEDDIELLVCEWLANDGRFEA